MFFLTNRVPDEGVDSVADRQVNFDDGKSDVSNSLFYCESVPGSRLVERMSAKFLAALKETKKRSILLYIHGYSNEPTSALGNGHLLQRLMDMIEPGEVEVVTLVWPCIGDSDDQLREYWGDQDAADMSCPVFARALSRFMAWQQEPEQRDQRCLKRLNVLAHSMGNRVLMNTLHYWASNFGSGGIPLMFRNAFLIGADIPSDALEDGQPGRFISLACRNVSVYHAADDKKMPQSVLANALRGVVTSRLGDQGPGRPEKTRRNVYRIDCERFNNDFDPKAGHGYYLTDNRDADRKAVLAVDGEITGRPSPILRHLLDSIKSGKVEADADRVLEL